MKRFIAVLSGLLVLPAFAEVAPIYYDDAIEMYDAEGAGAEIVIESDEVAAAPTATVQKPVVPTAPSARNTGGRTASRAVPSGASTSAAPTRTVTTRSASARNSATTARGTVSRGTTARATVSRPTATTAATTTASRGASTTATTGANRARRATTSSASVARAGTTSSIVQTDTVNTPLYTGRVGVRTNVSSRVPTVRMATGGVSATSETTASGATTTADMDELAQITDFCKAQYTQCMDNFCNVLDDNQGRCSCSANLKNYEKTEAALKQATEDLQEVAQKIQYIGLTSNEIETLFTQTEAELQMQRQGTDNTQLKTDLDKIKKLIVDVKGGNATVSDNGLSMDLSGLLDFTISSTGFDLSSLLGGSSTNSTISNQRGETLYKTAAARCKASVLNSCAAQGVDTSLITNAYDLEIDKQCIAYERSLTESNEEMASTVRNAKSVLQKARLMVAQNKNSYDLRGCISALDSCMQDEYVCGSDYENCLDPSGKYIVNGEIILGSQPGQSGISAQAGAVSTGIYSTWDYGTEADPKNAWTNGTVSDFIQSNMYKNTNEFTSKDSSNIAKYLQQKIGYIDKDSVAMGMCSSVLNKCQNYTYTGTGTTAKYEPNNQVVREYLERAMVQIKAAQDTKLDEYADDCISDVASCLSQNNYNFGTSYSTISTNAPSDVAIKACNSVITTCMSVTGYSGQEVKSWLDLAIGTEYVMTKARCLNMANNTDYTTSWNSDLEQCTLKIGSTEFLWRDSLKAFQGKTGVTKAICATIDGAKWTTETQCTYAL